jgi:hypothetical protein
MKHFFGIICILALGYWIAIGGSIVSPSGGGGPPTASAGSNPAGAHPIPTLAKTPAKLYNVKDYGATGNGSTDDTTAMQAAIDAADTAPAGTVWFPNGTYKHTGLIVGSTNTSGNGRQSHVSLVGENMIQTVLSYHGSTSGTAVRFQTNKYGAIRNLTIKNSVAKGTTTGLSTTGPSGTSGTYSNGNLLEQVLIDSFHYGWWTSSANGGTSSEITSIGLNLANCDTGFYNNDFNGLNFTFIQLSISNCTTGIDARTAGVHVFGGAAAKNATDFYFSNGGTNGVYNFRSETATQFVNNFNSQVTIADCLCEPSGAIAIYSGGSIEIHNSIIKGDIVIDAACQIIMTDTAVRSSAIIKIGSSEGLGDNRYNIIGCKLDSGSGLVRVPDRSGILSSTGTLLDNFQFDSAPFPSAAAKTSFFGESPVVQQSGNAVTALSNYGLVKSATWPAANITGTNTLPEAVLSTNVPLLNASSNNFTGALQAGGYKSSDGTVGGTRTTGGVTFKNGLYTSGTITSGAGTIVTAKTASYTVRAVDSNTFFTNAGASGEVDFTLPTAVAGQTYSFYVDAAQTVKIIAGSSTIIQVAGSTSAPAGNITNATQGACITLVAISTTKWVAASHEGTWTVN